MVGRAFPGVIVKRHNGNKYSPLALSSKHLSAGKAPAVIQQHDSVEDVRSVLGGQQKMAVHTVHNLLFVDSQDCRVLRA